MSRQFSRRTFFGIASAALLAAGARLEPAQADGMIWSLAAEIVPIDGDFRLQVSFAIDTVETEPLFVQVMDADDPTFFDWELIEDPVGEVIFNVAPYDVLDNQLYLVSIVTGDGQPHPLSPVLQIDIQVTPTRVLEGPRI